MRAVLCIEGVAQAARPSSSATVAVQRLDRCSAKASPLQCKGSPFALQSGGKRCTFITKSNNDEVAVAVQRVALCSAKWVKTWSFAVQRAVHCVSEGGLLQC